MNGAFIYAWRSNTFHITHVYISDQLASLNSTEPGSVLLHCPV